MTATREADAGAGRVKGEGSSRVVVSVDVDDWASVDVRRRDSSRKVRIVGSMISMSAAKFDEKQSLVVQMYF